MKAIHLFFLFFFYPFWGTSLLAIEINPLFPDEGILRPEYDSFHNPENNYKTMQARITDRSADNNVIKIHAENRNIHFLRLGDLVLFGALNQTKRECKGYVRGVDERSVSLYVPNGKDCFDNGEQLLRIGTQLNLYSEVMEERILYASQYRYILLKRRSDLLNQLNQTNHFLANYDQEVIKAAANFDKKILELKNRRQEAVDNVLSKKKESVVLQRELIKEIDFIDKDLIFYRIDRQEPMFDRWHMDKDSAIPVTTRPPEPIALDRKETEHHRWYSE